jgi:hypothetical protein
MAKGPKKVVTIDKKTIVAVNVLSSRPNSKPANTTANVVESCGIVENPRSTDSFILNLLNNPAENPLRNLDIKDPRTKMTEIKSEVGSLTKTSKFVLEPTITKNAGTNNPYENA